MLTILIGSNMKKIPSTKVIRKELAILIKEKKKGCTTEKEINRAIDKARQEINLKYGKGWREQWLTNQKPEGAPDQYTDHPFGEYWMD